ncbi:657_t:CDS:2, partial [Funneliformis geosporum]
MEYEYYHQQSLIEKPCLAMQIPPEIFISICKDLPPTDLLSLASVCKKFYGYLCSMNSFTTQEIWRNSRLTFLPFVQLSPPEGMTELQYVKLVTERGCQFCGKSRIRKIYWPFLVRCCKKCLEDRTIRMDQIRNQIFSQDSKTLDDILCGLTFTTGLNKSEWDKSPKNRPSSLYWIQDVHKIYNEFNKLNVNERQDWIEQNREKGRSKMEQKRDDRAMAIENLIRGEKNEYGFPRFKMSVVEKCMTYNKAIISSATNPFTKRAWNGFRNKLIPEYMRIAAILRSKRQELERRMTVDVAIQTRQMDIVKVIFTLLRPEMERQQNNHIQPLANNNMEKNSNSSSDSSSVSNDSNYNSIVRMNSIFESSMIKFLPWCPSFRNPPFTNQDPRNLWDDDFLMSILIPKLREEAEYLKKNPAPLTTLCGAFLHGGLNNKRIYKCKLCSIHSNKTPFYSFFEIRLHLTRSNHKVRMVDDQMIEVFPFLENASTSQIFPRNKTDLFFAA